MRISDWSSDVCSSDLGPPPPKGEDRQRPLPTPKDRSKCPSSKNPGDDSLRQRGAQVARFGKAVRRDAFRGEDGFGGLRGGVDDHPIGDALQSPAGGDAVELRSEEHTSELQSLMRIS